MNKVYLESLFSVERMEKYFILRPGDDAKSILHYQCNIQMSEAFYPAISTLEVALRNSVNRALTRKYGGSDWYVHFPAAAPLAKLANDINTAKAQISRRHETLTPPKIIAELTLGFWVRLFNTEFERILWKDLRLAFPLIPKAERQRHKVSAPLNNFRNFRNRIFHHEPICWNLPRLKAIHDEMITVMGWINQGLPGWIEPLDRFEDVLQDILRRLQ
jgi:hypothetical protein